MESRVEDEERTSGVKRMDGRVDGWKSGWMDGWMGGWMDGWMGGRMEESLRPTANTQHQTPTLYTNLSRRYNKRASLLSIMDSATVFGTVDGSSILSGGISNTLFFVLKCTADHVYSNSFTFMLGHILDTEVTITVINQSLFSS